MKSLIEKSVEGREGFTIPEFPEEAGEKIPEKMLRKPLNLPMLSQLDVARHYHSLAARNFCIHDGIYPLGSCTMKYNPQASEKAGMLAGFRQAHPLDPVEDVQGLMRVFHDLQSDLCQIAGMSEFSLQPLAGAHGELTGLMIIRAFQPETRDEMLVPDSSHGTNPASAAMAGFKVRQVASGEDGLIDLDSLKENVSDRTAGLMLTNPNTLGLFEEDILEISGEIHDAGGLLYYDGANLNAILGHASPGTMGFDLCHVNLHKTFATPHGGGGPGSGPVGVSETLAPYLPAPVADVGEDGYFWRTPGKTIGRVALYNGNFQVILKAYCYIRLLGAKGLKRVSEHAVLNARYLSKKLLEHYDLPFSKPCMHEFVLSARRQKAESGVRALDVGKRLLDYGVHAPTVYFPLIVEEALMIEPSETEPPEKLDEFAEAMAGIAGEAASEPEKVFGAPEKRPVARLDDVKAVKEPRLRWNTG